MMSREMQPGAGLPRLEDPTNPKGEAERAHSDTWQPQRSRLPTQTLKQHTRNLAASAIPNPPQRKQTGSLVEAYKLQAAKMVQPGQSEGPGLPGGFGKAGHSSLRVGGDPARRHKRPIPEKLSKPLASTLRVGAEQEEVRTCAERDLGRLEAQGAPKARAPFTQSALATRPVLSPRKVCAQKALRRDLYCYAGLEARISL